MCCLKYEQDAYEDLLRITPKVGAIVQTGEGRGKVTEVNLLTGGGPANSTSTITQYLYNYGIKSLDFGFGSAGAIVMTVLVLLLSSVYIKRAIS